MQDNRKRKLRVLEKEGQKRWYFGDQPYSNDFNQMMEQLMQHDMEAYFVMNVSFDHLEGQWYAALPYFFEPLYMLCMNCSCNMTREVQGLGIYGWKLPIEPNDDSDANKRFGILCGKCICNVNGLIYGDDLPLLMKNIRQIAQSDKHDDFMHGPLASNIWHDAINQLSSLHQSCHK